MKRFFTFASVLFFAARLSAQDNMITWNEKQPLQWFDFAGPVKDTSRFDAESFGEVKYNYRFSSPRDFNFEVYANFNRNSSWCKKESRSEQLLKHEQLHFDIAALYAKKLKEAFDNYHYSENFAFEIQDLFDQKKKEYHLMQQQYDEETKHSLNKQRQQDWEQFISKQLLQFKVDVNFARN